MGILVFKTNATEQHLGRIGQCLRSVAGIDGWDMDLEDIDRILRVKTDTVSPCTIEQLLQENVCECLELND